MARKTTQKAAAGDKPAVPPASAAVPPPEAIQSPGAGAASAAPEAGGAPHAPSVDSGASELDRDQPPGGDAETSSLSASPNDTAAAAATAPATEPAVAGDEAGDAVAVQIAAVQESVATLIDDVRGLVELAEFGPPGSNRTALDGVLEALGQLAAVNVLVGALNAALTTETADLESLSVRSRDGKPFRRAGLVLGDDYQTYRVTAEQAELIRADRRGCQIEGEN